MPTKVTGDYSKLPAEIREVFPYLYGEACELRTSWTVYEHLFMANEVRTKLLSEVLGPFLGRFQNLLQDEMFIAIGRMTDPDTRAQKNLTFWSLVEGCEKWNPEVGGELRTRVKALAADAKGIRQHRHKRLAHYDMAVSLEVSSLPKVTLGRIRCVIEEMQALVNFVSTRAGFGTIIFESLDNPGLTWNAELAVYKSRAYDALEQAGIIPQGEWEKSWIK